VYPALAVLQKLQSGGERQGQEPPDESCSSAKLDVLWVGGQEGMEVDLVKSAGIPFTSIPAAGLHGVGLRALGPNLWKMSRGIKAARRVLRQFKPDVILFTGGYVGVPLALAASAPAVGWKRPGMLVYTPDIEPGLAIKLVARISDRIAVNNPDSRAYFHASKRVSVTGYPVRENLLSWDRDQALHALGLSEVSPILLVLGGSRGARSINRAVLQVLPKLLESMQVIHVTGALDWPEVEATWERLRGDLPVEIAQRYRPHSYLHEKMGAAFRIADLALSRAGASVLGEYPLFGLPAILVPYPYAWRYQRVNAQYLEKRGAVVVLGDEVLERELFSLVTNLMASPERLQSMRASMKSLAHPEAAEKIANLARELEKAKCREKD
jgi:UDP-N-acetylglucosamine--N-acetylmuramyl-(pentapeptide) pyrophosphoryl-undecaprenol N-acetylglucosamine transferase